MIASVTMFQTLPLLYSLVSLLLFFLIIIIVFFFFFYSSSPPPAPPPLYNWDIRTRWWNINQSSELASCFSSPLHNFPKSPHSRPTFAAVAALDYTFFLLLLLFYNCDTQTYTAALCTVQDVMAELMEMREQIKKNETRITDLETRLTALERTAVAQPWAVGWLTQFGPLTRQLVTANSVSSPCTNLGVFVCFL